MAQIVKLRRSSVIGKKPTNAQLELGELSINTSDGKVYFAKSGSLGPTVEELVSTNTVNTGSLYLTGDITASHFVGDGTKLTGISSTLKLSGSVGHYEEINLSSSFLTVEGTNGIHVEAYNNSLFLTVGTITGSLNVSGSVTASYFVGDGSQLTNLPAAANVLNISGSDGQNTQVDLLNSFLSITGSGVVTASISNGGIEIFVPEVTGATGGVSAIYIADQSNLIGTASYFDFNGAGVTTTITDGTASVYIPGGGGGETGTTLSDGSYVFLDQTTPSTSWAFNHKLNQRYPIFQVFDTTGKVLIPKDIITVDADNALITFSSGQTGKVIASLGTGPGGVTQYFAASTTWTLNHNMGADYPIVTVWDVNKNIVFPQRIESVNSNTVKVYFSTNVEGYLNVAKGGHVISGTVGAGNVDFTGTQIVSGSVQIKNLGFATTGSNYFKGSQTISGSLSLFNSKIGDACITTSDPTTIFSLGMFDGASFDYVVKSGLNMRAGSIVSAWDGSNSVFNETSTTDLGDTSGIVFDVTSIGELNVNITDYNTWTISAMYRALGCGTGTQPTPTPTSTSTPTPTPTSNVTPTPTPAPGPTPTPSPTPTPGPTPSPTPSTTPTPTPTPSETLTYVGYGSIVGATDCNDQGPTPNIYLDSTDMVTWNNNSGCFSAGMVIRDINGDPIIGTFYFVYYGGSCSTTTFKSTLGNLTENPNQC
jgi:hypothetical protein